MINFNIKCDPNAYPFGSSRIITDATNKAAKKLGVYSDDYTVVYDCLCNNQWRFPAKAFWCAYEVPIPKLITQSANGLPIIGLSKENAWMFVEGGYPHNLCNYVTLGCDTEEWVPQKKKFMKDKFIIGGSIESTVRSDFPLIIEAFGSNFKGNKGVVLYLKDRFATSKFQQWVKEQAEKWDIEIIHDNRDIQSKEEENNLYATWDAHIYLNRAGTFCMTVMQGMACGVPTISARWSGPSDYLSHRVNGLAVDYDLVPITEAKLYELESLGMRNYLIPPTVINYKSQPYWAEYKLESLKNHFQEIVDDKHLREKLSHNGILTAQWFNWERTAASMSYVLSEFPSLINNPHLKDLKSRYN